MVLTRDRRTGFRILLSMNNPLLSKCRRRQRGADAARFDHVVDNSRAPFDAEGKGAAAGETHQLNPGPGFDFGERKLWLIPISFSRHSPNTGCAYKKKKLFISWVNFVNRHFGPGENFSIMDKHFWI
jgi:hypothetical protein